ncbi:MAG: hypothetical protein IKQ10_04250 [Oscillospiraceae bacterium]|nr:hypothetical protein [Oscillospiraceae bacterium]
MNIQKSVLAAAACVWLLGAAAVLAAPTAENLELTAVRGQPTAGHLTAYDPEGGEVTFLLTTPPVKGTLELDTDGRFVYTSAPNRRGRDYFGYRVSDAAGRLSEEATVIIRIRRA